MKSPKKNTFSKTQYAFVQAAVAAGFREKPLLERKDIDNILSTNTNLKYPYWITSGISLYQLADKRATYINPAYTGFLTEVPKEGLEQGELVGPPEKEIKEPKKKTDKTVSKKTDINKKKKKEPPIITATTEDEIGEDEQPISIETIPEKVDGDEWTDEELDRLDSPDPELVESIDPSELEIRMDDESYD